MGISVRAYAKQIQLSHTAVQRAVKEGRITPEPDGTIDPQKANAQWAANTRRRIDSAALPISSETPEPRASNIPDYKESRALREAFAARIAKLEYEEKRGKLVNIDEVKVSVFNKARRLRDRILQVPRKTAPEIVSIVTATPDVRSVEECIANALREALEDLSDDFSS